MEKEIVYTDKTGKELNAFLDGSFPFWVGFKSLSNYYGNHLEIHWHQELEFTLVTEGKMEYQANDTTFVIEKGNGIFVNTNILHAARQIGGSDCSYTAIRFSPALIGGLEGNRIYEQYINPILCCKGLSFLYLSSTIEWQNEILESLRKLSEVYSESFTSYEFSIIIHILKIWQLIYLNCEYLLKQNYSTSLITEKLCAALAYIHKAYASKLTLDDIAGACHYSKSECCRMFNKILHQSPMDYVISYRIHQSLPLIASRKYPMTEIAGKVGFSGSSYFSEVFHKIIGCTPTEYKKRLDIQKP
jgi:AraC family transcriptional regulator, melibiose operon regulatory protein